MSATPAHLVNPLERNPLEPWKAGEVWIHPVTGLRIRVEQSTAESGGASLVVVTTLPPQSPQPPLHLHPHQIERVTMLYGTLRIADPRGGSDLRNGDRREIPRGRPHAMWNPHDEPAVVRWETEPALKTEQLNGMLLALAGAGETDRHGTPPPLQMAVLLAAFRDEIRLQQPAPWVQTLLFPFVRILGRRRTLDLNRFR